MFPSSLHGAFATLLMLPLVSQAALGVYLKLHIHENTLRPWAVLAHGVVCVLTLSCRNNLFMLTGS